MRPPFHRRHLVLTLIAINVAAFLALLAAAEAVARFAIAYNPGYYTGIETADTELVYPYGVIRINTLGYPDDEFDLDDPRPRVAYVGDSVTFGVGAGHGHRFSDILEQRFPQYQHMTMGIVGANFQSRSGIDRHLERLQALGVDQVLYFYSLNDTLPDLEIGAAGRRDPPLLRRLFYFLRDQTQPLRDKSYFLNWVRHRIRILLLRLGYQREGYLAFEFFPERSDEVIRSTAERINYQYERFANEGIEFAIILIPLEMQISEDAEKTYASYGISWDESFIERGTQKRLERHLRAEIPVLDAYEAFVTSPQDRARIKVGEQYVYDKGDMLDYAHPNREGHRRIAEYLERMDVFSPLATRAEERGPPAPSGSRASDRAGS